VNAVQDRGGRFLLQLWHTGRISHPDLHGGDKPVAPSAIRPKGQAFTNDGMKDHVEPRALETDEIPAIVADYRRAAENRLRLPLAVVEAVVGVWGPGRVGIRLSPATTQPGGTALDSTVMETYGTYLDRLSELVSPIRISSRASPAPPVSPMTRSTSPNYGATVPALTSATTS
jgi:N-ethylmaleimide reductase